MSEPMPPVGAREARERSAVRGLDARAAARPALDVLAEIPWDGARLDPDETLAGVFLANL